MNLSIHPPKDLYIMWQLSESHPAFQKNIESEFQNRLPQNKSVSRELIFQNCIMLKNPVTLVLIPGSPSYNKYGNQITIDLITQPGESEEMMHNLALEPILHTHGVVKALLIERQNFTEEQVNQLKTEGIHTDDVLMVFTYPV